MSERDARLVIERALTARHEELSGEASPRDFDGASQILRALSTAGFSVLSAAECQAAFGQRDRTQWSEEIAAAVKAIETGKGSKHYQHGRDTMREDVLLAIDSLTPGVEW